MAARSATERVSFGRDGVPCERAPVPRAAGRLRSRRGCGPGRPSADIASCCLAALALVAAPPAHASPATQVAAHSWVGVSSEHIDVLTDAAREVGERIATRLEDLRTVLSLAAPALVADVAPVQIILFRETTLAASYSPWWKGRRDEVSGFFQSAPDRGRLLFADDRTRTPAVAQHEYIHALLDAAMPGVPLWLNEGLAEYFSTFAAEGDHAQAGAPVQMHLDWLSGHDLMPLAELLAVTQGSSAYHEGDRRGTFYAQSWLLTHMILSGTGDDLRKLEAVLVSARAGEPFARAFAREFGDEYALRERLQAYVERERFTVREWRLARPLGYRATRLRVRVPASEVLGSLGIALLSRATPEREAAEEHLRLAVASGANDPSGCAGLGWLALLRGESKTARGWFERALEREPVSVSAVKVLASQTLLAVGEGDDAAARAAAAGFVRSALERARSVDRTDPELGMLLARSWVVAPGADASPGWPYAEAAAVALPGRPDVQLDRLALAALTGRAEEAQRTFDRLFRDTPDPELLRGARRALLVGAVHEANVLLRKQDTAAAEARLRAARDQVADDPQLVIEAERFLRQVTQARTKGAAESERVDRENAAITHYNSGVDAVAAQRWALAAEEFRKAASGSARVTFRKDALRMALRMDTRVRGSRALAMARAGDVDGALAIFAAMDRTSMSADDRRWLDRSMAELKRVRGR